MIVIDQVSAETVLNRISIKNPPFPVSLSMETDTSLGPVLVIKVEVRDRNTGDPLTLNHITELPIADPNYSGSESEFLSWVQRRLQFVFFHELAECLLIDGIRAHETHVEGTNMAFNWNA